MIVERTGAGVPVVMLHSSGMSGRQWKRAASAIAERGLRAVVPDLAGHGASEPWLEPKPFSFRVDVDAVIGLLEAEGPAHLVGHSYGGLVALHAALGAPSRILGLSLYDPVAFGLLDASADAAAVAELATLDLKWGRRASDRERWLETFTNYWSGDGAWVALRPEVRAEFKRVAWVVREGVRSLMEDTTPLARYASIASPVLLITGTATPLAARTVVRRLAESFPRARVETIPGAGHMGPLTHGDAVNALLLDAITKS